MKYETIEAALKALREKHPERFTYSDEMNVYPYFWINHKRFVNANNPTIDDMYAILREIGYTMWVNAYPNDILKPYYLGHYYALNKYNPNDVLGCSIFFVIDKFDTPEQALPPAFLAALNHYLESING